MTRPPRERGRPDCRAVACDCAQNGHEVAWWDFDPFGTRGAAIAKAGLEYIDWRRAEPVRFTPGIVGCPLPGVAETPREPVDGPRA